MANTTMQYRDLGKTGVKVSAIGLGGFHLGKKPLSESEAIKIFHAGVDRGINFSDNSWDYNEGESEKRVGKALQGRRDKVFVMTKYDGRTKKVATDQLNDSLKRLQTDHIDLWQFHENIRLDDPDRFLAKDGAMEAMQDAKKAGKVKFFGFTGHKDPAVHVRMLEMAQAHGFHFDACQMPLNVMDAHFRSFEKAVLPLLVKQGIAVLGMKALGDKNILKANVASALDCLRYALKLPTSIVITGIDSLERLDQAFEAVNSYQNLDVAGLLSKTAAAAKLGTFEPFKTTEQFDSTAFHPEWLGNHQLS